MSKKLDEKIKSFLEKEKQRKEVKAAEAKKAKGLKLAKAALEACTGYGPIIASSAPPLNANAGLPTGTSSATKPIEDHEASRPTRKIQQTPIFRIHPHAQGSRVGTEYPSS
jgi:hypothetical protein